MYDSDEVRDDVRWDCLHWSQTPAALTAVLSRHDQAAVTEARVWYDGLIQSVLRDSRMAAREQRQWWVRLWLALLEEALRPLVEWMRSIGKAVIRALAQGLQPLLDSLRDGLGWRPDEEPPARPIPYWQRWPRRPDVRPARPIDPVAAGRHPAAVLRSQIRGGRR